METDSGPVAVTPNQAIIFYRSVLDKDYKFIRVLLAVSVSLVFLAFLFSFSDWYFYTTRSMSGAVGSGTYSWDAWDLLDKESGKFGTLEEIAAQYGGSPESLSDCAWMFTVSSIAGMVLGTAGVVCQPDFRCCGTPEETGLKMNEELQKHYLKFAAVMVITTAIALAGLALAHGWEVAGDMSLYDSATRTGSYMTEGAGLMVSIIFGAAALIIAAYALIVTVRHREPAAQRVRNASALVYFPKKPKAQAISGSDRSLWK